MRTKAEREGCERSRPRAQAPKSSGSAARESDTKGQRKRNTRARNGSNNNSRSMPNIQVRTGTETAKGHASPRSGSVPVEEQLVTIEQAVDSRAAVRQGFRKQGTVMEGPRSREYSNRETVVRSRAAATEAVQQTKQHEIDWKDRERAGNYQFSAGGVSLLKQVNSAV
jgi:hypothetical protein